MNDFITEYKRSLAKSENIIQGENYRFTILTPRLIRMEYSETGHFVDKPSEFAHYRDNAPVKYEFQDNDKYVLIRTSYFQVTYLKNKPFFGGKVNPSANLNVELLNSNGKNWYYGHPEIRNYGAPANSIDSSNNKLSLKRGIYSIEGFASYDDSNSKLIDENNRIIPREEKSIDIYLFMYLGDYIDALKDYYYLTGFPPLIPRYALGNWWSRGENYNDITLKNIVNDFAEKEIPLSIILLDKDWHINDYMDKKIKSGFTWNNNNFSNPSIMIEYLHSKGIRLGLNVDPSEGIYPYEKNFNNIANFLNNSSNEFIPFNVYDINYISAYMNYLINPLKNDGVDFFWIDTSDLNSDTLRALNYYHYQYGSLDYKKRPFIMTRNSNTAEHRYPVTYSGKTVVSWDTLKMIPKYNMLATNNGNSFWAHDIGGYHEGMEDNELYTRFVQLGTFSPILKFGSDGGRFYKREPWRWSYKTYKITKDYLKLRHNLIPYLYSEAYKYHKEAMPLIIPLYYEQPESFDDSNYNTEYFFGSEFFISPILKSKDYVMNRVIHRFYLPAGIWFDYVTGKKFIGGKQYLSFFKDEDYPVYVKSGSIIPLGFNEELNDTTPPKNMEIQIFPGKSNEYKLYEDDGISELYKQGYYLLTEIDYTYVKNSYTVVVRPIEGKSGIVPDTRNYRFNFRNTKFAEDVTVYINKTQVPFNKYSKNTSFYVEVNNVPTTAQLTVICKGSDIEISAERIFMEDIESIISDLQIKTLLKEKIYEILSSDLPYKKKRIEIRKLEKKGLERKFIKLFLQLLEYLTMF